MQLTYEEAMNRGKGMCTYCGSEIMYTVPDHDDMRFGIVVYRCYSKLDTNPDATNPYHTTMSNKCKALVDGKTLTGMRAVDQIKPYVPTATRPSPDDVDDTKACPKCGSSFLGEVPGSHGTYIQYNCGTNYSYTGKLVSWHPTCRDIAWRREFNATNANCQWCGAGAELTGRSVMGSKPNTQYYSCGSWYGSKHEPFFRSQTCAANDHTGIPQNNVNVPQSAPRQSEASYLEDAIRQAIDAMPIDPAEALRILREAIS